MDYTKKIIYQSNYWYNDGLRKAQIRDLSGAIISLRRSLQYNRGNIDARNLLGLVYYGRGEVAEALVEWIISKNLKTHENTANYYVSNIQKSAAELEVVNQAVKKYNQCLVICGQAGDDMAILQLKKVVTDHPALLKAWQLLALLYLHTEQYAEARQALRMARKIDTTNEMTLRFMHEMTQLRGRKTSSDRMKNHDVVEYNLGNETIIQPGHSTWREFAGRSALMNILIGMTIGAAIIWYLVTPAANQAKAERTNQQMIEYSQRIHALESQVSAQTRILDEYRTAEADKEAALATSASTQDSYERLMAVSAQFASGDFSDDIMADTLLGIDRGILGGAGQAMFDELAGEILPSAASNNYEAGLESLSVANFDGAIDRLSKVVRIDANYDEGGALLQLGIAFMNKGDKENAANNFRQVIERFPGTERAQEAQDHLDSLV